MSFYANLAKVTLAQIDDKGRDITLELASSEPVYNPITGNTAPASIDTVTLKSVVVDVTSREIDGTLIKAGDKWFLIAASDVDVAITPSAKVIDGGVEWAVQSVIEYKPADVAILYKLQCRLIGA